MCRIIALVDDVGTTVGERYELESLAGRGGMGSVYRARDRITGTHAAVKILRDETTPEHRERFIREAQLMSELPHPAFVRCLGFGSDGERPFRMEWLEGMDLAQRLQHGELSTDETIRLIVRVAAALGNAHARGIVHRDIKPSNLFLVAGDVDRAKVLDFGIAHVHREGLAAMTRTGAAIGTPRYMAPEQARARNYLALIEIDAGNFTQALGYVTDAIASGGDMQTALGPYLATASTACRLAGDLTGALAHAKRSLELIAIHGPPEEGEASIRLAYAHALHATGAHVEALAAITDAEAHVMGLAAKIQDDKWRACFLEAVPENAETLALARPWRA